MRQRIFLVVAIVLLVDLYIESRSASNALIVPLRRKEMSFQRRSEAVGTPSRVPCGSEFHSIGINSMVPSTMGTVGNGAGKMVPTSLYVEKVPVLCPKCGAPPFPPFRSQQVRVTSLLLLRKVFYNSHEQTTTKLDISNNCGPLKLRAQGATAPSPPKKK